MFFAYLDTCDGGFIACFQALALWGFWLPRPPPLSPKLAKRIRSLWRWKPSQECNGLSSALKCSDNAFGKGRVRKKKMFGGRECVRDAGGVSCTVVQKCYALVVVKRARGMRIHFCTCPFVFCGARCGYKPDAHTTKETRVRW